MFLSVIAFFSLRTETVIKSVVTNITDDFLKEIKHNGILTYNEYEGYMEKLSYTASLYDITFEHNYRVYEPEYRLRTLEEIIEAQNKAYSGPNNYYYRKVITDKPTVMDPVIIGNLNTESNESVLAKAVNASADPKHIHREECYQGEKHIHNDRCDRSYYSPSWYTMYSSTDYEYHSGCGGTIYIYADVTQCSGCGVSHHYSQMGCSRCGLFESSSNYTGACTCSGYYTYSCGKMEGEYYNGDTKSKPICHQLVKSLTPTHPIQRVYTKDPLIRTAVADYLDGSKKTVLCATSFSTATVMPNQSVTLAYSYSINGKTFSKSCQISVSIIPRNKACVNDHIYNMNDNGSDPGCPYCKEWVKDLRVTYPTGSTFIIAIGTTLAENGMKILVTYMDGHTETISSGYSDNLDAAYLGTKVVEIGYKGALTTIRVTTVRARTVCDICAFEYKLYQDGTNPGCPRCISETPIFTGNVMEYDRKNYTEAILDTLYNNGDYRLGIDDMFRISVNNKSTSIGRKLLRRIYPALSERWLIYDKNISIQSK